MRGNRIGSSADKFRRASTVGPTEQTPVPSKTPAGVVGMGLMGTSIAACLLIAGHPVVAVDADPAQRRRARFRPLLPI
jgi:threonine dehydrogenase-like Zn-dependent dehydrogenase